MKTWKGLFIGGEWVTASSSDVLEVRDAATEQVCGTVPVVTEDDIDRAIAVAREAFDHGPWPHTTLEERADVLGRIAGELRRREPELADLITAEVGSPIAFSTVGQAPAGAVFFDYYAGLLKSAPWREPRPGLSGLDSVLVREPVGVVAAIVPWNGPVYLLASKLAPALAAGCTIVIKPSPETALDAMVVAEAVHAAGLPHGVVSILPAGREAGAHLVASTRVDKVSFTGSTLAGRDIAEVCGRNLTRVALELGGKSAAVILDDVDPAEVLPSLLPGMFLNNGQACAALTRVLVPRSRHDEWVAALSAAVGALTVGDPREEGTAIGPLVAERQRDRVESYIALAREEGATISVGGGRPAGLTTGWFVEPTIISGLSNDSRVAQEEIFGPVAVVIPYGTDEEALDLANASGYGLAGAIFGSNPERIERFTQSMRVGTCSVNGFFLDPAWPFGGFKASGIGREGGIEGLLEYTEIKTIARASKA
ncbi:aldehyde dehydrogenase [Nocardia abscessus]|jgi:aldehyde dehydrogenase (NAD+)|uniref:aldehyde dehydrogenase n=1 Tax=Nocardia TaxID=1817 RepID=UPI0018931239|nr:aldehyde dehydrogenase [Nocardia abscessus]MBF6472635.1 aldehyde dehydrogenase [Nocardia abscessus]